jgi:ubiquinone/menaquinone biosynthesis C-methylase UbiE
VQATQTWLQPNQESRIKNQEFDEEISMSVASHLNIRLDEYDARIRTFIPGYEQMLDVAAQSLRALESRNPVIVDLGTGTGALAARCISVRSDAHVIGVDEDAAILDMARQRLARLDAVASFLQRSFLDTPLPHGDAIVGSLAFHHVRTAERKQQFYRDCRHALARDGLLISADCFVSADPRLAELEREVWRAHLQQSYSAADTEGYFAAWAMEDVYFPLTQELAMLRDAGFVPDIAWRVPPFAVLVARTAH